MGEVYRAHDTKLNRDVALKVLPERFAQDSDRLARFAREAQLLAALNHPNIASIYGLEETVAIPPSPRGQPGRGDDSVVRALVLELVEGPTLADRLVSARGHGLPLEEALGVAWQITQALEAAHAHGITHRDLKPANIKLKRPSLSGAPTDLVVKVLDFGLAKALD